MPLVAAGLPVAELTCAVLLLTADPGATVGAVASALLLAAFTVAIAVNLLQGRRPDCHCFGQLDTGETGWLTVGRNAVLIVIALVPLTRAGSLAIDASGTLVDLGGNPVLSDSGPVHFDSADTDIQISKTGSITTSQGGKGKLAIVEFADPQALAREGNNLFSGGTPVPPTETQLVQGSIERSNVSGVIEMAQMIRVERAYQQIADMMQRQDDIRSSAIQKLGSLAA